MSRLRNLLFILCSIAGIIFIGGSAAWAQAPAVQEGRADAAFKSWLESLSSDRLAISTESIEYEPTTDVLAVKGLQFGVRPSTEDNPAEGSPTNAFVRLDNLKLTGFVARDEGVSFKAASIGGLELGSIFSPGTSVKLEQATVADVFVPGLKGFTADQQKPISSQVALFRLLTAAKSTRVALSGLNVDDQVTVDSAELSGVANAAIELVSLRGVTTKQLADSADNQSAATISAGEVLINRVDLDPYLRLFEASAYLEAGSARPWRNLIEQVAIRQLAVKRQDVEFTSDALSLDRLKVRQFEQNLTDLFDQAAVNPGFLQADQTAAARMTMAVRNAFEVDAIGLTQASLKAKGPQGEVDLALGSVNATGISAEMIKAISLSQISFADSARTLKARSFAIDGLVLPSELRNGNDNSGAIISSFPQASRISVGGFEGKIEDAIVSFSNFNLDLAYFIAGTPTSLKLSLDNLKLGVNQIAVPAIRDTLSTFGYKDVELSLAIAGAWQERSSEIAVENAAIAVSGLGKISASGSLTGVTRAAIEQPATILPEQVAAGGLKNFRLAFQNETFFQRLIKEIAKQNQRTEDDLSKALSANMPAIMGDVAPAAVKNKLIFAGVSFVNDPRSLEFVSTTGEVIAWQAIQAAFATPAVLPGLLQLDVRANGLQ